MVNYWLIYWGLNTPLGTQVLVKHMATLKMVFGTYFGGIIGFYLILLMMSLMNGLSGRFFGKTVQGQLSETVGGLL